MKKDPKTTSPYQEGKIEKSDIREYLPYPPGEDIYSKFKEEKELDPEDISKVKQVNAVQNSYTDSGIDFENDDPGSDLDIPGTELDDEQEIIGNEDEENNYYSIGGDGHNDLDEDRDYM